MEDMKVFVCVIATLIGLSGLICLMPRLGEEFLVWGLKREYAKRAKRQAALQRTAK